MNELGQAVGETTGRPVMHLQDLLVALRGAFAPQVGPITCSIEPTPEGIRSLQKKLNQFGRLSGQAEIRQVVARKKEIGGKPRGAASSALRCRPNQPLCLDARCGRLPHEVLGDGA